jgi:tetratricopeptide (TPR) repeat protein/tRNA A-37 threonylcarbamoyl transferase component Bud32
MNQAKTELQLLFGLLALQNDLIDRDALIAAFQAWSRHKGRSLGEHLVERGALEEDDRGAVEALVARYVRKHGSDPEKSLAAVTDGHAMRGVFLAAGAAGLGEILDRIGASSSPTEAAADGADDRTATHTFGVATAEGRRFLLLRPHARGGIGQVGVALDTELNREVALKEIQPQLADDPASRGRFLLEAEVTGRLEHPGVVPVYGLGADAQGRPYYAMRLIRGDSFKQAIDRFHAEEASPARDRSQRSLALRGLLNRFVAVCNAVAYAHSRGVIHRDLKPSNVMLGPYGETLVVDWGLAKVVGRDDPTASPEATLRPLSASGSGSSETQAGSAIGTPAYMSPEQAEGRLDAIGPQSDVYSLGATLYYLLTGKPPIKSDDVGEAVRRAQQADVPPLRAVNPRVSPGLEAICRKAMAARAADRYRSPRELAGDVEHWLADEPVSAWREPWFARSWRWARRHRTGVSAAAVLLVAAVVGLSTGALLLQGARVETENQRRAAVTARNQAEAINRFLIDDLLKQADPTNNPVGDRLTVVELVDKAASRLDGETSLGLEPRVEAEVRSVIGHAYEYLGAPRKSEPHYARAAELRALELGPDHPQTLAMRNRHAWALALQARLPEAETLAVGNLEACTRVLGDRHPATFDATSNLASVRDEQARYDEAVALRRRVFPVAEAVLGPDDNMTLEIGADLAVSLARGGKPAEAVPILQSVVDRRRRVTPRHPELANALGSLGGALIAVGHFAEAENVLREAAEMGANTGGPFHNATLGNRNMLCYALEGQQRWEEAERDYKAVLDDRRHLDGDRPASYTTRRTLAFLARLYAKQQRWPEAAGLLSELILTQSPDLKQKPDALAAPLTAALTGAADPKAAARLLEDCRKALEVPLWRGDWLAAEVASRYGDCLRRQGKFAEAEPILVAAAQGVEQAVGSPRWGSAVARKRVAELYEAWGKPADAANWH